MNRRGDMLADILHYILLTTSFVAFILVTLILIAIASNIIDVVNGDRRR